MTDIGATMRRRIAVASAMAAALAIVPRAGILAQRSAATALTPRCASNEAKRDTLGRRALVNGYSVTISRRKDDVEDACIATLRDANGRVVLADSGFGAAVDAATGLDIDGDGTPELVLEMDTGGGNHCCWHYAVISLKRPARRLFDFDWQGATYFKRDAKGRVILWSREGGLNGDGSMAGRLFADRAYHWNGAKLVDETPAHCDEITHDTTHWQPPMPDADAIRRLAKFGVGADSTYGLAEDIEELMLQQVFCHRFEQAFAIAQKTLAEPTRSKFVAEFRDKVVAAYKEYAEPLRSWR